MISRSILASVWRTLTVALTVGILATCRTIAEDSKTSSIPPLETIEHAEVVDDRFPSSSHGIKTANAFHLKTLHNWAKKQPSISPDRRQPRVELTLRFWQKGEEKPTTLLFSSEVVEYGQEAAAVSQKAIGTLMASLLSRPARTAQPNDGFAAKLGQKVTLVGFLESYKMGPRLRGEDYVIWIDGEHEKITFDRRVIVTGTVIERNDLPVFVPEPGVRSRQGIPVPKGTDLQKASHRYLLKDATWKAL